MSIIERASEKRRLAELAAAQGTPPEPAPAAVERPDLADTEGADIAELAPQESRSVPAAERAGRPGNDLREAPAPEAPPPAPAARRASSLERAVAQDVVSLQPVREQPVREQLVPVPNRGETGGRVSREIVLDLDRLRGLGYLTGVDDDARLRTEFRRLKRPLLAEIKANALSDKRDGLPNIVLVTSSVPGEGKTFTALNLAMSIASEVDQTALLIDGDVVRRSASTLLGVAESPGLIDLLDRPAASIPDVICRTNVKSLTVIPAGRAHGLRDELFASSAAGDLLAEISARYEDRVVIIDTPPVLATSEAMVLCRWVGLVVFVVEADRTPQQTVQRALAGVPDQHKLRLVLNKTSRRIAALGGDDHGYYDYEYRT